MKGYYRQKGYEKVVFISATSNENIVAFKQMIFEEVKKKHLQLYPNFLKEGGFEFSPFPVGS
jgi:GTP-binding protein HflX